MMLLAVFLEQSGKYTGLQTPGLLDHSMLEQKLCLLSTTLNVLNKAAFENLPRTLQKLWEEPAALLSIQTLLPPQIISPLASCH